MAFTASTYVFLCIVHLKRPTEEQDPREKDPASRLYGNERATMQNDLRDKVLNRNENHRTSKVGMTIDVEQIQAMLLNHAAGSQVVGQTPL